MGTRASPLRFILRSFYRPIQLLGWLIWKTFSWTVSILALLVILAGLLATGYASYYVYWDKNDLPTINPLVQFSLPSITEVKDTNGITLAEFATEYRKIITYQDIPLVVEAAILSAEDKRFWRHDGKDYLAIIRAGWEIFKTSVDKSIKSKKPELVFVEGGSTIDQQLIRLFFREIRKSELSPNLKGWKKHEAKLKRKLKEIKLAIWMEKEFTKLYGSRLKAKEEILTRFVNMVYLDFGRYGFASASEFYFNKPIQEFTMEDAHKAALLAGMVKSPSEFSPLRKPSLDSKRAVSRRNSILDLMATNKFMSPEETARFKKKPLEAVTPSKVKTIAPSAIAHTFEALPAFGLDLKNIFQGNIQVRLTIDGDIQSAANEALEKGLKAYEERHPENAEKIQGAVLALRNQDGAILAEVGGRFFKSEGTSSYTEFNRAVQAKRQPGSAFKPFTYLTALENGWLLDCKQGRGDCKVKDVSNICIPMGRGKPKHCIKNYDGKYKGAITLRQALAESRNAATVWLAWKKLGIKNIIETAHRVGIKSPLEPYPTTAIGASEVTLFELTNTFRTIASDGILVKPYIIEEIKDAKGNTVTNPSNEGKQVIQPEIALFMQEALRGTVRLPNGTGNLLDNTATWRKNRFPIPVICKTGTTSDFKDAWIFCSTAGPDGVTIGVWIGMDDGTLLFDEKKCKIAGKMDCKSGREPGGKVALPVVRELLLDIYKETKPDNFPDTIEKVIDEYLGRNHTPSEENTDESDEQPNEEQSKSP